MLALQPRKPWIKLPRASKMLKRRKRKLRRKSKRPKKRRNKPRNKLKRKIKKLRSEQRNTVRSFDSLGGCVILLSYQEVLSTNFQMNRQDIKTLVVH